MDGWSEIGQTAVVAWSWGLGVVGVVFGSCAEKAHDYNPSDVTSIMAGFNGESKVGSVWVADDICQLDGHKIIMRVGERKDILKVLQ